MSQALLLIKNLPEKLLIANLLNNGTFLAWASCSSKGRLTFSFELLNKTNNFRAKVIVHELLHLKYPYHGKMFTSLLTAYLSRRGIKVISIKFSLPSSL